VWQEPAGVFGDQPKTRQLLCFFAEAAGFGEEIIEA
jgi:hypothetical protein